jgi:hypothetical protein
MGVPERMRQAVVLAVGVLFVCCTVCHAWGPDGHFIIARIAESYLTPKTKTAVSDLLDGKSLCDAATWADRVRKQPEYAWSDSQHGVTIRGKADSVDLKRDCPNGCAVSAILKLTDTLERNAASRKEREESLKFLVHFVSDLHQPIHVVSPERHKNVNDNLTFFSKPAKLHAVWDGLIIVHAGKPWEEYSRELRDQITRDQFASWSAVTDPVVWANESHDLLERYAYDLPADGQIGQAYCDRCLPVLNERMSVAGVRLATRLNAIFDAKPSTRPTTTSAPATRLSRVGERGGRPTGP